MKPVAFELKNAASVADAIEMLVDSDGQGKIVAGGQSLGPMLNLRLARPTLLVNIRNAEGSRDLFGDDKVFSIGAGWTHAEIEDGIFEDPTHGFLKFVARGIAYRAVRNRGTMGGSLAHADPAADWVTALAALGATVVARGPIKKTKRFAAETFVEGAFLTKLADDEILTAIEVPRLSTSAKWAYYKICRKTGEFANAIGVAILDQKIGLARVLAGATDGSPVVLTRTAAKMVESGSDAACTLVADELQELRPDLKLDTRELHAVAVRRALMQSMQKRD